MFYNLPVSVFSFFFSKVFLKSNNNGTSFTSGGLVTTRIENPVYFTAVNPSPLPPALQSQAVNGSKNEFQFWLNVIERAEECRCSALTGKHYYPTLHSPLQINGCLHSSKEHQLSFFFFGGGWRKRKNVRCLVIFEKAFGQESIQVKCKNLARHKPIYALEI